MLHAVLFYVLIENSRGSSWVRRGVMPVRLCAWICAVSSDRRVLWKAALAIVIDACLCRVWVNLDGLSLSSRRCDLDGGGACRLTPGSPAWVMTGACGLLQGPPMACLVRHRSSPAVWLVDLRGCNSLGCLLTKDAAMCLVRKLGLDRMLCRKLTPASILWTWNLVSVWRVCWVVAEKLCFW